MEHKNENQNPTENTPIKENAYDNKLILRQRFGNSFDLIFREINSGKIRYTAAFLDGMCDRLFLSQSVIRPISQPLECQQKQAIDVLYNTLYEGIERDMVNTIEEAEQHLIAGSLVIFADACTKCVCFNAPVFARRAVGEPQSEQQEKGSKEGFTDFFKDNVTLLRRRLRTPALHIEKMTIGKTSNTFVCLCYLADRTDSNLLDQVRTKLTKAEPDILLGAGSLRKYLENSSQSFFSGIGATERPDTFAAKLAEGRVGLIIDGVPFALFMPQFFTDHLHTMDDYLTKTYYAFLLRILRLAGIFIATLLPGLFVAICVYHPEILPTDVMFDIAVSISQTPFPLMIEALIIHFIYEIVREAGLRMPKAVGHAVSIVGALVIGDAAVTAGLIAAPMLIIVALTAVSSAIIPGIHEPMAVLRFLFILAGGLTGLFGSVLLASAVCIRIGSISPFGLPFSAPISPYIKGAWKDFLLQKQTDRSLRKFHF